MTRQAIAQPQAPATVTLVPLGPQHLARTLAWANDPELMRLLNRAERVSEAEHRRWFAALETAEDRRYFAIEVRGTGHVGNVWLWDIDRRHQKAEVRIVIGEGAGRDRGVGPRAIELVTERAFGELDLHRLYAYVLAHNPRAGRAFEKAGFTREGVLREDRWTGEAYSDAIVLGRVRN